MKTPTPENYHEGSAGSLVCDSNIRKYPTVPETKSEKTPSVSDHPVAPPDHELREPAANEIIRRAANRKRDGARRWGVINSPLGVEIRKSK
jgi:hypothetical protein